MKYAVSLFLMFLSAHASAQTFGSAAYCGQLADIGAKAYRTKKDGHPMETVLRRIGDILADDPQKKRAAQGVVIAIYGDGSIKSEAQAYDIVYSACRR